MKDTKMTQVFNSKVSTTQVRMATNESPLAAVPTLGVEQIRELAYQKWQAAGYPDVDGIEFWLQAERELALQTRKSDPK